MLLQLNVILNKIIKNIPFSFIAFKTKFSEKPIPRKCLTSWAFEEPADELACNKKKEINLDEGHAI